MNFIFTVVYSVLRWMSDVTGLSYNEINIIVFYFCIPAIFLFLIDCIIKRPGVRSVFRHSLRSLILFYSEF